MLFRSPYLKYSEKIEYFDENDKKREPIKGEPIYRTRLFHFLNVSENNEYVNYSEVNLLGDDMFFKEYISDSNFKSILPENNLADELYTRQTNTDLFISTIEKAKRDYAASKLPTTQPTETKEADKKEDKDCTTTPTN